MSIACWEADGFAKRETESVTRRRVRENVASNLAETALERRLRFRALSPREPRQPAVIRRHEIPRLPGAAGLDRILFNVFDDALDFPTRVQINFPTWAAPDRMVQRATSRGPECVAARVLE